MGSMTGVDCKIIKTPLKRIHHPDGDILHGLRSTESSFNGFGEAYFTSVKKGAIKGWKKHNIMVLNLVVPVGNVVFYTYDEKTGEKLKIRIGRDDYSRLTIPSGIWLAFEGVDDGLNLILNVASIPHDPLESESAPISTYSIDINKTL